MAKRVQFIRHTTGNADAFKGLEGEVTVDITKKTLRVHDGVNAGGTEVAKADLTNVNAATATSDGKMSATHVQTLEAAIPKVSGATAGNLPKLQDDGTIVDSGKNFAYAEFPAGTRMVFAQAAAPTGWTQDTANNDAALRVVSSAGGGTGGVHGLSSPPSTAHTHSTGDHALTVSELPAHSHSFSGSTSTNGSHSHSAADWKEDNSTGTGGPQYSPGGSVSASYDLPADGAHSHTFSGTTANTGSGAAHNHGPTASAGPTAFQPKYVDVIIAQKD